MKRKLCNRQTVLRFLFGLICGYCIGQYVLLDMSATLLCLKDKSIIFLQKETNNLLHQEGALQGGFIYIGVMSAGKFLSTRVEADMDTWIKHLPPGIKVDFFSENNGTLYSRTRTRQMKLNNAFKVIQLPGVSDRSYPPQKKSFSMLKFMHDMYIDKYDWFVRLDDDAYIETTRLQNLLARINSSKPIFMGHVGFGLHDEDYLGENDTFCMGGTGMILSKELLRLLAPKLKHCITNLLTDHEDIELGRCIQKMTGVKCTMSWEAAKLFNQDYSSKTGYITDYTKLYIDDGVTFHPNKDPAHQRKLHVHLLQRRLKKLISKTAKMEQDLKKIEKSNSKFIRVSDCKSWKSVIKSIVYKENGNMREKLNPHWTDTFKQFKSAFRQRKSIKSLSIPITYYCVNPLFSLDFVSKWKVKYVYGKVKTRNHQMIQRQRFPQSIQFFHEPRELDANNYRKNHHRQWQQHPGVKSNVSLQNSEAAIVNYFMIVSGRKKKFLRFLSNFEQTILKQNEKVNLIVVYFPKEDTQGKADSELIQSRMENLQKKYINRVIKLVNMQGVKYCKTTGLQKAKEVVKNKNEIIFFCDVDMKFSSSAFLWHIRQNTVQGKRVFYPITFSQYNPEIVYQDASPPPTQFEFGELDGFWRIYGFGMFSIYRSDFDKTKGFDTRICGWGQEDVEMANSILRTNLDFFQSANPFQIHVYHHKYCDKSIPSKRLAACKAVRSMHHGPRSLLYKLHQRELKKYGFL